jgi:DNA-binding NtrC family response regulator
MAKILIVDDERDVVYAIRQLLTARRHELREATNGLTGLELFQTQFFDLIITDLGMTGMDGVSFLYEVRQLDPSIPVIVLTTCSTRRADGETMGKGAWTYLDKPCESSEVLSAVERVLSMARSHTAA